MLHYIAIGCNNKSYRKTKEQINQEQNVEISFHRYIFITYLYTIQIKIQYKINNKKEATTQ